MTYRWSLSEFVRAFESGAFDRRAELIDGEIWPVVIGSWRGRTAGRLLSVLPRSGVELTNASLPAGDSLPDPDFWVQRSGATAIATIGGLDVWDPADVLLVVEMSSEAAPHELNAKMKLYGSAGFPVYWVVTEEQVFEHTGPTPSGYRLRTTYSRGERIPVGYAGLELAVDDLI
jgi:hypothetical protein